MEQLLSAEKHTEKSPKHNWKIALCCCRIQLKHHMDEMANFKR